MCDGVYTVHMRLCGYIQGVMGIVISLGFCGLMLNGSAFALGNVVGKGNEGVCVC